MGKASKIVKCVDCGREFPRKELNRGGRCQDCGMAACRDSMIQLHQKSGPYYERWRESIKAAAGRL